MLEPKKLYRPGVLSLSRYPKTTPVPSKPFHGRIVLNLKGSLNWGGCPQLAVYVGTCSLVPPTVSGPISHGSTWACLGYKDPLWIISHAWMVSFGPLLSHCDISEYNSRQMYGGTETWSIRTHAKGHHRFKYNRVHVSSVRTQRMSYAYILRRRSLL